MNCRGTDPSESGAAGFEPATSGYSKPMMGT